MTRLSKSQIRIVTHITFWTLFIAFDSLSTSAALAGYYGYCLSRTLIHTLVFTMLIYPHFYYFYPQYFSKGRYQHYIIAILVLLIINILLRFQIDYLLSTPENVKQLLPWIYDEYSSQKGLAAFRNGGYIDENGVFSFSYYSGMTIGSIAVFTIAVTLNLSEDWLEKQRLLIEMLKREKEEEHQKLELQRKKVELRDTKIKFLKAQTDPHFLINSISGVYNLALLKSDKIETSILRLSDLMSYLLGDGKEDYISLKSEVKFIENYIEFSKAVYLDNINIHFDNQLSFAELNNLEIPPMLIQPFLENALKHSDAIDNPKGWIKGKLKYEYPNLVIFVENTITPNLKQRKIKSYGVGYINLKSRLEIYYPNNYNLTIKETKSTYSVCLEFPLA